MTNESDSFIQEVDESLRQDRAITFVKRWGPYLLAVFVVVVLGVAGWQWWRAEQVKSAQRQSDVFVAAVRHAAEGDLATAKTALQEMSDDGPEIYRLMARMEHAGIVESEGDLQAALGEFDAIAEDAGDPLVRDTARMRAAYLVADTQDFDALRTRLQPLIDGGGRLSFLAQELLAVEAWEAGDSNLARETLQNLQLAFDAPESVRQRAELALAVVGPAPPGEEPAQPAQPAPEGETE